MRSTKVIKWEPLDIEGLTKKENLKIEDRLRTILSGWLGTVHMDGQQEKGVASDCVRFVAGVLDELHGTTTPLEILPCDISFHNKETAWRALRMFRKAFKGVDIPKDGAFQPGDVLVVGPPKGGPGHAMIVGPDKRLWHCDGVGVMWTGLGFLHSNSVKFKKALRTPNRQGWL